MLTTRQPAGTTPTNALASVQVALRRWFDTSANPPADSIAPQDDLRIDWLRAIPFIGMHVACLAVFWVGASVTAVTVCLALYAVRMFAITGFYHRYFAHRSFKTGRAVQFVVACIAASSVQRGPLWWAAHHRHHHQHADQDGDPHSPTLSGLLWSHMGWFLTTRQFATRWERIPDLARFPELRWLDRYDILMPAVLAVVLFATGKVLAVHAPQLHTSGAQLLVWGFFVSTILLFHITVSINSIAHKFGTRRYDTDDTSRNNALLALLTFGEGWHNNHHFYQRSARQGFRWWEIDLTYYGLKIMSLLGLIHDLRPVPARVLEHNRDRGTPRA